MKTKSVSVVNLTAALALSIIFVFLGLWQLNRASDLQDSQRIKRDLPPIVISEIAKPGENLRAGAINRLVKLSGNYGSTYSAPNQTVRDGDSNKLATLEVRLMKLKSGGGILVVRGYEKMSPQNISGNIDVIGRLYPRQSSDVTEPATSVLTRIDPSLIAGDTNLDLIDGYVVVIDEKTELGQSIYDQRIPADRQLPKVAGYYWQHLSYVGIWWLFAIIVLLAPFYDRFRDRKMRIG